MFSKVSKAIVGGVIAAGLVLGGAVAANAASYTGTKSCTGTRVPAVTVNAKGPGSIGWANTAAAGTATSYFPGGQSVKYAPYQNTAYTAVADLGFYSAPTATCA